MHKIQAELSLNCGKENPSKIPNILIGKDTEWKNEIQSKLN